MIEQFLSQIASFWPQAALIFFLVFFALALLWTLRGGRSRFVHETRLPLEDDQSDTDTILSPESTLHE